MAGPGGTFSKGRLVLVFSGLSVFIIGSWLVIKSQEPEVPVVTVRAEPDPPEQPIAFYLAQGDAARGERLYTGRCAPCHSIAPDAPHGIGPNLLGAIGNRVASRPGFENYSPALRRLGGSWDWAATNRFLRSPREVAPGTRMVFAGLTRPQDRADVMLYLNRQGGSLPWPEGAR
jgi:cytochrome c